MTLTKKNTVTVHRSYVAKRESVKWEALICFFNQYYFPKINGDVFANEEDQLSKAKGDLSLIKDVKIKTPVGGGSFSLKNNSWVAIVKDFSFFEQIKTRCFHETEGDKYWHEKYLNSRPTLNQFQKSNELLCVCHYDHTFRKLDGTEIPVCKSIDCHIWGSKAWDDFGLLGKELKRSKYVFDMRKEEVPCYNHSICGNQQYHFKIYDKKGEVQKAFQEDKFLGGDKIFKLLNLTKSNFKRDEE